MLSHAKRLLGVCVLFVLCIVIACQTGGLGGGGDGGVTLSGRTYTIRLDNVQGEPGVFDLSANGEPDRNGVSVELFQGTPADSPPGGTLFVDPQDVRVTGAGGLQANSIAIAVYLGPAGSTDPCEEGVSVGSFTASYDGSTVSLGTSELPLPAVALSYATTGTFTLCLIASGDIDATLEISRLTVQFAPSAEPEPDGDEGDGEVDDETLAEVVAINEELDAYFDELLGLVDEQGEEAAKQAIADKIAADPGVAWVQTTAQGVLVEYTNGAGGILLLDPRLGDVEVTADPPVTSSGASSAASVWTSDFAASGARPRVGKAILLSSTYSELKHFQDPMIADMKSGFTKINLTTAEYYLDQQCTLDRYFNLDGYGIIHFEGHGTLWTNPLTGVTETYLMTFEEATVANTQAYVLEAVIGYWRPSWYQVRSGADKGKLRRLMSISPKWIVAGLKPASPKLDLGDEGSLLWLGFCYSWLGSWQNEFIDNAHAAGILGYDWSVFAFKDTDWARSMYTQMCDITLWTPMTISFWHDNTETSYLDFLEEPSRTVSRHYRGTPNLTFWEEEVGRPEVIGSVVLPTSARAVHVVGYRAYVVDKDVGLHVINVGNPYDPSIEGSAELMMHSTGRGVYCDGTYAYVGGGSFHIVDVSNPASPTYLSGDGFGADCSDVVVQGDYAYIAAGSYSYTTGGVFVVADITDPANADKGRGVSILQTGDNIRSLAFTDDGRHVCLSDRDSGQLYVVDVSDPANPRVTGNAGGGTGYGGLNGICVSGNYAHVSNQNVFDVSNPAAPVLAYDGTWSSHDVDVVGTRAYYVGAGGDGGYLAIADVSDPTNPQFVTRIETDAIGAAIDVVGQYAYVAQEASDGSGVLTVIDLGS